MVDRGFRGGVEGGKDGVHAAFGRLLHDESGQGLVEYALVLALIAVACIVALRRFGSTTSTLYTNIANATNAIGN